MDQNAHVTEGGGAMFGAPHGLVVGPVIAFTPAATLSAGVPNARAAGGIMTQLRLPATIVAHV